MIAWFARDRLSFAGYGRCTRESRHEPVASVAQVPAPAIGDI